LTEPLSGVLLGGEPCEIVRGDEAVTPCAVFTTENTTLKQRVRHLSDENRTLSERLQAARSNTRFQDRHIAQLEAELIYHTTNVTNMHATSNPRSEGKH